MTDISNAQAGCKFLAEAILVSNDALYVKNSSVEIEAKRAKLKQHIQHAIAHFDAQFDQLKADIL